MLPVTEGLLVDVLGTHLVLLVFVVWQIAQCLRRVALPIRRARRLVIGEMDCDELIDELMSVADPQSASGGLAEGVLPAAAPAATPEKKERVQKRRERLAAIAAGVQAGQYGLTVRGKTADQIKALDNTEIEKLYARYEARLGGGDDEDLVVCGAPALCGDGCHVPPNRKPARAYCRPRERPVCRTRA